MGVSGVDGDMSRVYSRMAAVEACRPGNQSSGRRDRSHPAYTDWSSCEARHGVLHCRPAVFAVPTAPQWQRHSS
jgi:hypothetical protein